MSQNNHSNAPVDEPGLSVIAQIIDSKPKRVFAFMVAVMAISIICVSLYTFLQEPYKRDEIKLDTNDPLQGVSSVFPQLMNNGQAISDALRLEREIIHLLDKAILTKADSTKLAEVLDQMEAIQNKLNPIRQ